MNHLLIIFYTYFKQILSILTTMTSSNLSYHPMSLKVIQRYNALVEIKKGRITA